MKALFQPAIFLLNRFGYTRKFAIMGAMALVAILVLLTSLYHSLHRVIDHSERELAGIEAIKPIVNSVRQVQIHRGLSFGVLNGNNDMKEKRAAKEKEVVDALQTMDKQLPELRDHPVWGKIREGWTNIQKDGLGWLGRENFMAHNRLIEDIFHLLTIVADEYRLTNDPDIDTTYLIATATKNLPEAIESMGQLRALGTGALTRATPLLLTQQVDLSTILANLNTATNQVRNNLEKCVRYNPNLGNSFQTVSSVFSEVAGKVTEVV
ncbi:MAG TPA: nitrate- and nitrite sensing domain-containing protein, partial [Accumulibacter sp.]|nr:nitrate- and nitrite sensing domain-containing protein [Accumulibacter sp.]